MRIFLLKILPGCFFVLCAVAALGQASAQPANDSLFKTDLVISYDIKVESGQKKVSVADAYDGGSKTLFLSGKKARIRLVSLMRMESIYFLPAGDSSWNIYQAKESMKKPEKRTVAVDDWKLMNSKYDSSTCELMTDSADILLYKCYRAVVKLADGRKLDVYFTKELPRINALYEPAFAAVPGAVLKYSYAYKSGSITYTAVSVKRTPVDPAVFSMSAKPGEKIKL